MHDRHDADPLRQLARLHGVELSYHDIEGVLREAQPEVLVAVLRALGAPLEDEEDAADAVEARRRELDGRLVEPVLVAWDGDAPELRVPAASAEGGASFRLRLVLESGEEHEGDARADASRVEGGELADGSPCAPRAPLALPGPRPLPLGLHMLHVAAGERRAEVLVIAAPRRCLVPGGRFWGAFLPLYALRDGAREGVGTYADLEQLTRFVTELGGSLVGTTPLLAGFLETPFVPSPYAPASRLFWNELHVDEAAAARRIGPEAARALAPLALDEVVEHESEAEDLVDYRRAMSHKRRALEALANVLRTSSGRARDDFERFRRSSTRLGDFARFRAACEHFESGWRSWPAHARGGELGGLGLDSELVGTYEVAQWLADEQLRAVRRAASEKGLGLFLDFPVGVHPDSFDTWSEQRLFGTGIGLGAPPDALFSGGQNWDFPPLLPDALRETGYRYLIDALSHHMQLAGVLRLDHVMALERLYWIPEGVSPKEGVYVRYPADEQTALLALLSHRHGTLVLGEDLGTVPDSVRERMSEHGLLRMHVGQFELSGDPAAALRPAPQDAVSSVNTHDTPTFAGFWKEAELDVFEEIGCLSPEQVRDKREERAAFRDALPRWLAGRGAIDEGAGLQAIVEALYAELAAGDARVLLVNLEDLWLEDRPQNVPGTGFDRPNWRRPARLTLGEMERDETLRRMLEAIDAARRRED